MQETILKKQKYLQFPLEVATRVSNHLDVEKLSLHQCYNGKLIFQESQWPNLRFLEIIGCSYLELSLNFPTNSALEQIYITQSENLDIGSILGQMPHFSAWRIENSKYIKFKGEISGNIGLRALEFDHALRSEIFQQPTSLPNLTRLVIQNGSNFFKLNLRDTQAPNLHILELKDSNYVNIQSMGNISPQLTKFAFENCAYPKLSLDFTKFKQIQTNSPKSQVSGNEESPFNPNLFRKVKSVTKKKKKKSISQIAKEHFTDPNSPDLQLYNIGSSEDENRKAQEFLGSISKQEKSETISPESSLLFKFCPDCGTKAPRAATFCSECGAKFPLI